eukprot:gb/GECG01014875.1/.p1 GENE.gb/GECG01014875.1/~~gb/GECG01014875.1/.p1  ORF type:complete len:112 (+),score=7.61 gb/GECG01014875.1/:1-336(+)
MILSHNEPYNHLVSLASDRHRQPARKDLLLVGAFYFCQKQQICLPLAEHSEKSLLQRFHRSSWEKGSYMPLYMLYTARNRVTSQVSGRRTGLYTCKQEQKEEKLLGNSKVH